MSKKTAALIDIAEKCSIYLESVEGRESSMFRQILQIALEGLEEKENEK